MAIAQEFRHDEDAPQSAQMAVRVVAHRSALERALQGDGEWVELSAENVIVIIELSPDAWRGLGRAFSSTPTEPEWRLVHTRLPNSESAATAWSERRAYEMGPGGWVHPDSAMFEVRVRDFCDGSPDSQL